MRSTTGVLPRTAAPVAAGRAGRRRSLAAAVVLCLASAAPAGCAGKVTVAERCPGASSGAVDDAKAVLGCNEGSIAYVSTLLGSGTGVVIQRLGQRYVLTNQHVVEPFGAADVRLGTARVESVPVVGIDAAADIALLGPVPGLSGAPALSIAPGDNLQRGDKVFLVGYPAESSGSAASEDSIEATITSGIVSRIRKVDEFDQTYLQTDAAISGGQSGGPMFDAAGRFVGVSGLSFGDNAQYALALSGRSVSTSVERIVAGGGDEYLSVPLRADDAGASGTTKGSLQLANSAETALLFLPAADADRTVSVTVDRAVRPIVTISGSSSKEPLAISADADAVYRELANRMAMAGDGTDGGGPPGDFPTGDPSSAPAQRGREPTPGSFEVPVAADEAVIVSVSAPLVDGPATIAWTTSEPAVVASKPAQERPMSVGDTIDAVLSPGNSSVTAVVDLVEGQEVQLYARSPQADSGFVVYPPGVAISAITAADLQAAGAEVVEDTDDGLYGLDARSRYRPSATGTYRISVHSNDQSTVGVRFSISACSGTSCPDPLPAAGRSTTAPTTTAKGR